jgi:peptidoglycan/xylan/chitin deacetylase (PgdA/CDA1 family)
MPNAVHVLCYHRVLPDEGRSDSSHYFLRGTAVSQSVFKQHVRDITEQFECLDEERALAVIQGTAELQRPGCWITFDDAYVDVVDSAAPLLDAAGLRASVFVSTAVLDGSALPADRWYTTLRTAHRRRGTMPGREPWPFDLDEPSSLHRFIDGPEKRLFLRSSPEQQEDVLRQLAAALDASTTVPDNRIYLGPADLRSLSQRGWSVGSHTVSHPILLGLARESQEREFKASRERLSDLLGSPPRTFAYPDGVWDETVACRVSEAGYAGAVTLEPTVARPGGDMFAIPRVLARNDPYFVKSLASAEVPA